MPGLAGLPAPSQRHLEQALDGIFVRDPSIEAVWALYDSPSPNEGTRMWLALHRERDSSDWGLELAASLADGLSEDDLNGRYVMASFGLSAAVMRAATEGTEGIDVLDMLMGEGEHGDDQEGLWRFEGRSFTEPAFPPRESIQKVFVYSNGSLPLLWESQRGSLARHAPTAILSS